MFRIALFSSGYWFLLRQFIYRNSFESCWYTTHECKGQSWSISNLDLSMSNTFVQGFTRMKFSGILWVGCTLYTLLFSFNWAPQEDVRYIWPYRIHTGEMVVLEQVQIRSIAESSMVQSYVSLRSWVLFCDYVQRFLWFCS